jgi:hypothetical protein
VHVLELLASGDVAALKAWSKQDKSVVGMVWNTPNYQLFFDKNALTFRRVVQVFSLLGLLVQQYSTVEAGQIGGGYGVEHAKLSTFLRQKHAYIPTGSTGTQFTWFTSTTVQYLHSARL